MSDDDLIDSGWSAGEEGQEEVAMSDREAAEWERFCLPVGWTERDWELRDLADQTPAEARTDEQWALLDRALVWADELEDAPGAVPQVKRMPESGLNWMYPPPRG